MSETKDKVTQATQALAQNEILIEMDRVMKEEAEKRKKAIMRRTTPAQRSLANALMTLTRQELDDIRYNVGLSGTSGMNKAELVEKLVPAVIEFSREWFTSMVDEQYQAMRHMAEREGLSTQFRLDEMRMDYFQSIGLVVSGAYNGKPAWYMPNEIVEEFKRFDAGSLAKEVEWNTDVVRIASGILYYYGVQDYEQLFQKVKQYQDERDNFTFSDFVRVMYNGACWQRNFQISEQYMYHATVLQPEAIATAQQQAEVGYAKLSYTKVYDAGEENYIESNEAYQALAQYFMRAYGRDVLTAARIVGEITVILQNGGKMANVLQYIDTLGAPTGEEDDAQLAPLLIAFHNTMRLWIYKGHTTQEMMSGKLDAEDEDIVPVGKVKKRTGRNDLCPCGSGKKYKNCCMRKENA